MGETSNHSIRASRLLSSKVDFNLQSSTVDFNPQSSTVDSEPRWYSIGNHFQPFNTGSWTFFTPFPRRVFNFETKLYTPQELSPNPNQDSPEVAIRLLKCKVTDSGAKEWYSAEIYNTACWKGNLSSKDIMQQVVGVTLWNTYNKYYVPSDDDASQRKISFNKALGDMRGETKGVVLRSENENIVYEEDAIIEVVLLSGDETSFDRHWNNIVEDRSYLFPDCAQVPVWKLAQQQTVKSNVKPDDKPDSTILLQENKQSGVDNTAVSFQTLKNLESRLFNFVTKSKNLVSRLFNLVTKEFVERIKAFFIVDSKEAFERVDSKEECELRQFVDASPASLFTNDPSFVRRAANISNATCEPQIKEEMGNSGPGHH